MLSFLLHYKLMGIKKIISQIIKKSNYYLCVYVYLCELLYWHMYIRNVLKMLKIYKIKIYSDMFIGMHAQIVINSSSLISENAICQ